MKPDKGTNLSGNEPIVDIRVRRCDRADHDKDDCTYGYIRPVAHRHGNADECAPMMSDVLSARAVNCCTSDDLASSLRRL